MAAATLRLTGLSSTTSTRSVWAACGSGAVRGTATWSSPTGQACTEKWKVEPVPGVLLTPMRPPISSTRCLQIMRPSPVPPWTRAVEVSPWAKGWNSSGRRSALMPGPVSETLKHSRGDSAEGSVQTRSETSPWLVNLMALDSRLSRI